MAIQKTEAFVLKTQPFRSSSLIVTFFSRDFGKLRGVVKGVRREREMRGALYELFTHLEILFYEKTRSDLHLVSEASILN
ncbi:MAG: DNA repair protein RecO, partial [Thermodesulfobacteriota bacterium]